MALEQGKGGGDSDLPPVIGSETGRKAETPRQDSGELGKGIGRLGTGTSVVLWAVLFAGLIAAKWLAVNRFYARDELEAVHTVWKIAHGERIYVDFFQHHHPLMYYLLVPVMRTSGDRIATVDVMRGIMFLLAVLTLVATYRLGATIYGKRAGLVGAILLCGNTTFLTCGLEIRPDVPQTLFGIVSLILLMRYHEGKRLWAGAVSALCLAVSFMFLQKAIVLGAVIGVILLVGMICRGIRPWFPFFYGAVLAVALVPFYVYVRSACSWPLYVTFNWELNRRFLNQVPIVSALNEQFWPNQMFVLFALMGLLFGTRTGNQKRLAFAVLGLLASFLAFRTPYPQYFLPVLPLLAVAGGRAISGFFERDAWALLAITVLSAVPGLLWASRLPKNHEQVERINYVLSVTDPSDRVYDGALYCNLFRKDTDFFWFSVWPKLALETYQTMTNYHYDTYELIAKYSPKVVFAVGIGNLSDPRIRDHYYPSPRCKGLLIRREQGKNEGGRKKGEAN